MVTLINPEIPLDLFLEKKNNFQKSVSQPNRTFGEGRGRWGLSEYCIVIYIFFSFTDKKDNFTVSFYITPPFFGLF